MVPSFKEKEYPPSTDCTQTSFKFPPFKRRRVQAEFSGGEISSDGGAPLLRAAGQRIGLTEVADRFIVNLRNPKLIHHPQLSIMHQRIYGLCLGYEDLNDHATLCNNAGIQSAVERDEMLGNAATLFQMGNRMARESAVRLYYALVDLCVASRQSPPEELILDFDATDGPLHGRHDGRFFHGYYDNYCFVPLYVRLSQNPACKDKFLR
jgi:hypothetical protein